MELQALLHGLQAVLHGLQAVLNGLQAHLGGGGEAHSVHRLEPFIRLRQCGDAVVQWCGDAVRAGWLAGWLGMRCGWGRGVAAAEW